MMFDSHGPWTTDNPHEYRINFLQEQALNTFQRTFLAHSYTEEFVIRSPFNHLVILQAGNKDFKLN